MRGLIRLAIRLQQPRRSLAGRYAVTSRRSTRIGRATARPRRSRANNQPSIKRLSRYL